MISIINDINILAKFTDIVVMSTTVNHVSCSPDSLTKNRFIKNILGKKKFEELFTSPIRCRRCC